MRLHLAISALLVWVLGGEAAFRLPQEVLAPELAAARQQFKAFPSPGAAIAIVSGRGAQFLNLGVERIDGPSVTSDTVFQIASLTKPFTAIVILKLAEEGRLRLDDRAARWIDWLPSAYAQVTLRQLLNHTSGVLRDVRRQIVDDFDLSEFRRRFVAGPPSFAPGERWEYSNTGYTLLSLVAENAGGSPFERLLEDRIFRPLAMMRTRYRAPLIAGPGRAAGHDWEEDRWRPAPAVYSGFGNSGIESTSSDLARFAVALQERRLLNSATYAEMLAPARLSSGAIVRFQFRDVQASYGLGWFLADYCGRRAAFHGGTIAGFSSSLFWSLDTAASSVVVANGKSGPDRIGVADKIAQAAFERSLNCTSRTHSARNARIGSTRPARSAGTSAPISTTPTTRATAAIQKIGSYGVAR